MDKDAFAKVLDINLATLRQQILEAWDVGRCETMRRYLGNYEKLWLFDTVCCICTVLFTKVPRLLWLTVNSERQTLKLSTIFHKAFPEETAVSTASSIRSSKVHCNLWMAFDFHLIQPFDSTSSFNQLAQPVGSTSCFLVGPIVLSAKVDSVKSRKREQISVSEMSEITEMDEAGRKERRTRRKSDASKLSRTGQNSCLRSILQFLKKIKIKDTRI